MNANEQAIIRLLRNRYPASSAALLPQVADRTAGASRIADAIVMQLWPSNGLRIEGFEIKVSRGDWRRELKDLGKAETIYRFCDLWWIITTANVIDDGDLPETWGHLEVDGDKLVVRKHAKPNPAVDPPTRVFVASLLRAMQKWETGEDVVKKLEAKIRAELQKAAPPSIHFRDHKVQENYEKLKANVEAFEKASGIHITEWSRIEGMTELGNLLTELRASKVVVDQTISKVEHLKRDATMSLDIASRRLDALQKLKDLDLSPIAAAQEPACPPSPNSTPSSPTSLTGSRSTKL
jgi:hypothetical protein